MRALTSWTMTLATLLAGASLLLADGINQLQERWKATVSQAGMEQMLNRSLILEELATHKDAAAAEALKGFYKTCGPTEQRLHLLRSLGMRGGAENIDFVCQEFQELAAKEPIAIESMREMILLCQDTATLEKLAANSRACFRAKGMEQLIPVVMGKLAKKDDYVEELRKLLKNPDPHAAGNAAIVLCQWGDEKELKAILKMVKSKDRYERVCVARALGCRLADAECLEQTQSLLADREWQVRLAAATALAENGDKVVKMALCEKMAAEARARVKWAVAEIFKKQTGKDFGVNFLAWRKFIESGQEGGDMSGGTNAAYFGYQIQSDHVVFIIDTSGSMTAAAGSESRMARAKKELAAAVTALTDKVYFNIISYSSDTKVFSKSGLLQATTKNKTDALAFVEALQAEGGTATYDAFKLAMTDLTADTIYLLSDGMPTLGKIVYTFQIRMEIARQNLDQMSQIHCIGLLLGKHEAEKTEYMDGMKRFLEQLASGNFGAAKIVEE